MSIHVSDILKNAASKHGGLSPVDIVMGEDWGVVEASSSSRLSLLRYMQLRQEEAAAQSKGGGGAGPNNRLRIPVSVMRGGNKAMVKVIKKGGTGDARGMRDQMSYLEKDGDAKLERSERYFGTELDEISRERLIDSWGLSGESTTQSDKTTHFVVSFPQDTDHEGAYRAGRAWADTMFASGNYGDVYDYYTAFHTDRAHPHMHVIVNRRGMEEGDWLKVSRVSQFNYDEFRAVQVEVSVLEGIHLDASPRLARGVSDRPIPDAEITRAEKEEREPKAPEHTPTTALRAASGIALYAQEMMSDAGMLSDVSPVLSEAIMSVANILYSGKQIGVRSHTAPEFSQDQINLNSEIIMSRRSEILDGIERIDSELSELPVGEDRSRIERMTSSMKAEAAEHIPDVVELSMHTKAHPDGYYQGVEASDGVESEIKQVADNQIRVLAREAGIDPEMLVTRYDGSNPASLGLADQWRKDELEDIQKNLTYQDNVPQDQYEQLAQVAYDELHENALQTYRQAERELEAHAARKKELHRIAKLLKEGKQLDQMDANKLPQLMRDTLVTEELRHLERGQSEALNFISKDAQEQRSLNKQYLEQEAKGADRSREIQLNDALNKVAREIELVAQQAVREAERNNDRGMDY